MKDKAKARNGLSVACSDPSTMGIEAGRKLVAQGQPKLQAGPYLKKKGSP